MKRLVVVISIFLFFAFASSVSSFDFNLKIPFPGGEKWQISSGYGPNAGSPYHKGSDYYALDFNLPGQSDFGKSVVAAASGKVTIGYNKGYGNFILIDHRNGYKTRYAHLNKFSVNNGQEVKQGETIGELGNTGNSSGPHLHFVLYKDGKAAKPEPISGYTNITVDHWYVSDNYISRKDPEPQVDSKYLLTFNGVGGVELLASKEEVERTFGAPKEKALQKMHEYSTDPKDLTEVLEAYIYEGLTIYFYKDKMVYFEVMSPKYRTYYNIGVGSSIGSLLETYSDLKREEAFDAYYFEFPKSSIFSDRKTYFFERNGKIDYIIIGLKDYLPEC